MVRSAAHRSALRLLRLVNDINLAAGLEERKRPAMRVVVAVEAAMVTVAVMAAMAMVVVVVAAVVVVQWACTHC